MKTWTVAIPAAMLAFAVPAAAQSDPALDEAMMTALLDLAGAASPEDPAAARRRDLLEHVRNGGLLVEQTVNGQKVYAKMTREELTAITLSFIQQGFLSPEQVPAFVRLARLATHDGVAALQAEEARADPVERQRRFTEFVNQNRRFRDDDAAPSGWPAQASMLKLNWREHQSPIVYHEHIFTPTTATLIFQGDPPDYREVAWRWEGIPQSLSPGQEFTVRVIGKLNFRPAGSERGANASAGIYMQGVEIIRQENAYFFDGASREGIYVLRVPDNATKVVIEPAADNNLGTFARYCYGAC